jgi:uncharacterized protein
MRFSAMEFHSMLSYASRMRAKPAERILAKDKEAPAGADAVKISVGNGLSVSGLLQRAPQARACFVLAHGAGAGMTHPFMANIAMGLACRGISVLRFQFPYMEARSGRPDPPAVAQAAVRAAVNEAATLCPGMPLLAGGKSFGGRMTSQAQAETPLPSVCGLIFLGFPLHPPGKPSDARAEHLGQVRVPMLFLQGSRDEFASLELLKPVVERFKSRATLKLFAEADHSFHAPKRTGLSDEERMAEILDTMASWIDRLINSPGK